MKIGIIGTGYVGLPTGVGLAELGNTVVCVDKIKEKVDDLKQGKLTIYEDGLEDLFKKNIQAGRLTFTTNMKKAIEGADVVIAINPDKDARIFEYADYGIIAKIEDLKF